MNQSKSKSNGKKKKVKIIEVPYKPREYQKEVHNNRKRFSVLVCHRRFGKSVLSINELIKTAADFLTDQEFKYLVQTIQIQLEEWDLMQSS